MKNADFLALSFVCPLSLVASPPWPLLFLLLGPGHPHWTWPALHRVLPACSLWDAYPFKEA